MKATLYLGHRRSTEVPLTVSERDVERGYSHIPCPECESTGWWAYAEPLEPGGPCNACKGTRRIYVNV